MEKDYSWSTLMDFEKDYPELVQKATERLLREEIKELKTELSKWIVTTKSGLQREVELEKKLAVRHTMLKKCLWNIECLYEELMDAMDSDTEDDQEQILFVKELRELIGEKE